MELGERKFRILEAIIDDFILTAAPVGSRTISRKTEMGLSSATIRNEMSDLEELGFLDQPHTSAGRVPSLKAYRLYVDHLMRNVRVSPSEIADMRKRFDRRFTEVGHVMERTAHVLSDETHYTSIVVAPKSSELQIRRVQLVPVSETSALVIIVTSSGIVKDAMIRIPETLTPDHLYMISKRVTQAVENRKIGDMREGFLEIARQMNLDRESFMRLMQVFDDDGAAAPRDIVVGGTANILHYPEYSDTEKARAFLNALDTREKWFPLLDKTAQLEFSITIGPENQIQGMDDCSVVSVAYHLDGNRVGSMGVVGPTRMNYSRVVAVLECMRHAIAEVLSGMSEPPENDP